MTISNQTIKNVLVGDGANLAFVYTFEIRRAEDIRVAIFDTSVTPQVETLLVLTTDYTVSGIGNPTGGTVTLLLTGQLLVAPVATDDVTLQLDIGIDQLTDYVENDPFPADTHEDALDKLTQITQQQQEIHNRSIQNPPNVSGVSTLLPEPVANTFLGWNATATALINLPDPATGAAASAAAALVSETNAAASAVAAAASAALTAADVISTAADAAAAAASAAAALVSELAAAASASSLALPTPTFPANEGQVLVARAAAAPDSYTLEVQGVATIVDDFTIKNVGGVIETAPFILDNIMLNSLQIAEGQSLSVGAMVDGVRDTFTDQTGVDLINSSDQVFEGGSYRTPDPISSVNTKLLINATAYNLSREVLDSSTQDHVITQVGNATLSPNHFKRGNGSLCLNGVDQTLTLANSADWDLFSVAVNSFTIDCWIRFNSLGSLETIITQGSSTNRWEISKNTDDTLEIELIVASASTISVISSQKVNDNDWHHIIVSKVGAATPEYAIYYDGIQISYGADSSLGNFTDILYIGSLTNSTNFLDGYIDDLRITNNNAFTTAPIPLPFLHLTLDDNLATTAVVDFGSGANNGTTVGGFTNTFHADGKVRFGFNFDGATDNILVDAVGVAIAADTTGTLIMWINPDNLTGTQHLVDIGDFSATNFSTFRVIATGAINFVVVQTGVTQLDIISAASSISANVWTQIAVVQDGVAVKLYINGVDTGVVATTGGTEWLSAMTGVDVFTIGSARHNSAINEFYQGRIDDFRYYSGVALTTVQIESIRTAGIAGIYGLGSPNITVPTVAHTDNVNTLLLLPFDSTTQGNDLIDIATPPHTVTSVAGAGVTGKFGNAYATFDGTGDQISTPNSANWDLAGSTAQNYSIDFWIRHLDHAGTEVYIQQFEDASNLWEIKHVNASGIDFRVRSVGVDVVVLASAGEITDNNWHHILLAKFVSGGPVVEWGLYKDGSQISYVSDISIDTFTGSLFIGADGIAANAFGGDIDDLHINTANLFSAVPVVGLTDTITVPAIQAIADGNSVLLINGNTQDESVSIQIPTFSAGASIVSAQSQFGGFSYEFNGTTGDITFANNSGWDIFSDTRKDQSIQMWVRHVDHVGVETYITQVVDASNHWKIEHTDASGVRLIVVEGGVTEIVTVAGGEITDTVFHHILLAKVGSENSAGAEYGVYVDGTQIGYVQDASIAKFSGSLVLGSNGLAGNFFDGNIDGLQVVQNNILTAAPNPGLTDTITVPLVAPSVQTSIGIMTLRTNAVAVAPLLPAPTTIKLYIDLKDISPTVLANTDFRGRASRDGGTTFSLFTASAFVRTGQATSGRQLYVYDVDVSAQPDPGAGLSTIVCEIETLNDIQMRFHAMSKLWG